MRGDKVMYTMRIIPNSKISAINNINTTEYKRGEEAREDEEYKADGRENQAS